MLNTFQQQLYTDLIKLSQENDDFFFKDFPLPNSSHIARIFNYRLGSYSAFLKPGAMHCRGVMFEVDHIGNAVSLLSKPMEKFFSDQENPMTIGLNYSEDNIFYVSEKRDGSLISTYFWQGALKLKSKGSTQSKEVAKATELLNSTEYADLKKALEQTELAGYTVDLEYTAPDNQIVLEYAIPQLKVISIQSRENFDVQAAFLPCQNTLGFGDLVPFQVEVFKVSEFDKLVADLETAKKVEGLVVYLKAGKNGTPQRVKIKAKSYLDLHLAQDNFNGASQAFTTTDNLVRCIVRECADDLKVMFAGNQNALDQIQAVEAKVIPNFNHWDATITKFIADNKDLARGDFAKKGQTELGKFFNIAMQAYLGKPVDLVSFVCKNPDLVLKG